MESKHWIVYMFALFLVCGCGYTDWTMQKIPNKWTLPAIWLGLLANLFLWGINGFINSFIGLLLGSSLFLLFVIRVLKAGDVKLFMALGAILGWQMNLWIMVSSVLIGGIAGVIVMVIYKNGRQRFRRLWLYIKQLFLMRRWERYDADGEGAYFCFGICITAGTCLVLGAKILRITE